MILTLLLLIGCPGSKDGGGLTDDDKDNDGFDASEDCDDSDASINPDADERCDVGDDDEDCNGSADNNDPDVIDAFVLYHDADGDGYGDDGAPELICDLIEGYVLVGGDCDDADPDSNPDAFEVCDAADKDENCNGLVDDADPWVVAGGLISAYPDADGDGYGAGLAMAFCDVPVGYVADATDCNDAMEIAYPGASEVCDGYDNDCDGLADESDAADAGTWYADLDEDGFGGSGYRHACTAPEGFVADSTDCDDEDLGVYPGAQEACDGEDDDCDGTTDESDASGTTVWYADDDGDTYGDATDSETSCDQPSGFVSNDDDCNDASAAVNPGATETCDAADRDEDCDGLSDDDDNSTSSTGKTNYYVDSDGDTYGHEALYVARCDSSAGYVTNNDDCDDDDASISPLATEVCDADDTDEDCDNNADDNDSSVSAAGKSTYYRDADLDGYGVSTATVSRCDVPSGYSTLSTDCDDTNALRDPGNTEVCDSADLDEDCDNYADDNDTSVTGTTNWYVDGDGDGYGADSGVLARCNQPSGYIAAGDDCDDSDVDISPAETEVCGNTVDEDCDGLTLCDAYADQATLRLTGENAGDGAGLCVSNAGDVNGDGTDDLIVSAGWNDSGGTDAGKAYVYYTTATGTVDLSSVSALLTGEDASDAAGFSVSSAGDVNSDGKDDVLIGATGDDDGGSAAGKVYIVKGRPNTNDLSVSWAKFVGENAGDGAGGSVAAAGDVSGDSVDDWVVGASGRSSSAGAAYLITLSIAGTNDLSTATAILTGESSSDYAGVSVGGDVDVNADGYSDFIVGAWGDDDVATNSGAAYIILGPQSGTASLSTADAKRRGAASSDLVGFSVTGAGDVNDDGYDDVLIGGYGYSSYGAAFLELGPITGTASVSSADAVIYGTSGAFGKTLGGGGDVDGDGYADIAIGNQDDDGNGTDAGSVNLFMGPLSGTFYDTSADATYTGSTAGDYFGASVDFVGAQDAAVGESDLFVGATGDDDGGSAAGSAYLFESF